MEEAHKTIKEQDSTIRSFEEDYECEKCKGMEEMSEQLTAYSEIGTLEEIQEAVELLDSQNKILIKTQTDKIASDLGLDEEYVENFVNEANCSLSKAKELLTGFSESMKKSRKKGKSISTSDFEESHDNSRDDDLEDYVESSPTPLSSLLKHSKKAL